MARGFYIAVCFALAVLSGGARAEDWLSWHGPHQDGRSDAVGIVAPDPAANLLWSVDLPGRGTPVVAGDRVFVWGYEGAGEGLAEVVAAFDLASGRELWRRRYRDFLSDIVYERYSIGAPSIDPETGNVYVVTSAGLMVALSRDGAPLWELDTGALYGRMTFPNGRTGAPLVVEDMVVLHAVTANWGREGPARDRLYAFDKRTGTLLWSSTPGVQPQDNSWSTPVTVPLPDGRLALVVGTGCGELVAVDARTGQPMWRAPFAKGGVNVTPAVSGSLVIASHAVENLDSTRTGGMFAFDATGPLEPAGEEGAPVLRSLAWRNDVVGFSSSPVLADGVLYQVAQAGELYAIDAASGAVLWSLPLGTEQLHASPVWADGELIVPMSSGHLLTVQVDRAGGRVVRDAALQGQLLGAPAIASGRVLVHSTSRLYAFGEARPIDPWRPQPPPEVRTGPAAQLRVRPAEVVLRPGESVAIQVDVLDAAGRVVQRLTPASVAPWVPPTAKVRSEMRATWANGRLTAPEDAGLTAGAFQVRVGDLVGTFRGRTVSGVPYRQDFEGFTATEPDARDSSQRFAWPPLPWIGARFKWDIRQTEGGLVLAKNMERVLFQRALTFIGHPDQRDYAMTVDVMSDGDARQMSVVGVIHQRYIIAVKGNQRALEVSSNQDRFKHAVPFVAQPGVWYRLHTEVSVGADGAATIRAKVWPRDQAEPEAWTLEVRHAEGHTQGAPGLFGFTPKSLHKVYIDNIAVDPLQGAAP
ncbi:MAG TPA: PQQ-binding-like beta-propeller repeat protein [Myxococcota bacterium]|nr:PQQ-binding-like beta-propeller repeat protein [Myxococcota bacterium]